MPKTKQKTDEDYMRLAINEAKKAKGPKRVGAIAVLKGKIIALAHNATYETNDPVSCAESNVISKAARKLGNRKITGTTIYTTMESCLMCIGAILKADVDRVVFGLSHDDYRKIEKRKKLKYWEGHFDKILNRIVKIKSGVLRKECKEVFLSLRTKRKTSYD
jgi:tRNA(Arg) A34 adenosine deaminase TadA